MQKLLRVLAVLSSLSLLAGFLYFQTYGPPGDLTATPGPETQRPLEMAKEEPESQATPAPKATPNPAETFIFSTKSGRIITPSATPAERRPETTPQPFLPSSKSRQIVLPPSGEKEEEER